MALDFSWNTVLSTQNDADSPITEDWGEAMRQNDYHLRQTVYGDGAGGFHTAVDGHKHTGTDSELVDLTNQIGTAELKSTNEVHTTSAAAASKTLTGAAFCFWFEIKTTGGSTGYIGDAGANGYTGSTTSTSYAAVIIIGNSAGGGGTTSLRSRYVTASGDVFWLWILRDKVTKEVVATQSCTDHPCYGNSHDPEKTPHPFLPEYDEAIHEIISIQAAKDDKGQYPEWFKEAYKEAVKKNPHEPEIHDVLMLDYEVDEVSAPQWHDRPVVVGFKEKDSDIMGLFFGGKKATPKKVKIPKPSYVLHRSLKKKS